MRVHVLLAAILLSAGPIPAALADDAPPPPLAPSPAPSPSPPAPEEPPPPTAPCVPGDALACTESSHRVCSDDGTWGPCVPGPASALTAVRRSAGQSCAAASECQAGLSCVERVCVEPGAPHADERPAVVRVIGAGTAVGVGGAAASSLASSVGGASSATGVAILLPSLELQFFLGRREYSIDVSVPLTNIIVVGVGAATGFSSYGFFNMDAFFNFNFGSGGVRWVAGPGLGFTALVPTSGGSGGGGSFRVPAELGVEFLTAGRGFGFKTLARPWFEVAASGTTTAVGGGAMFVLAVSGYSTARAED